MSFLGISVLTLLPLAIPFIAAQQSTDSPPACAGKFNRQPCLTSNGTSGACMALYPPCAVGFKCDPYWMCDPTQTPLTDKCTQAGTECVVGDANASVLGSCVVGSPCPTSQLSCPGAFNCATPTTGFLMESLTDPSAVETSMPDTERTSLLNDPNRMAACQGKASGDACTFENKPGKCGRVPPQPAERKRVRLPLSCFETTPSQTDKAPCKEKKAGDSCGDRMKCVQDSDGALACTVADDAPSASAIVSVTSATTTAIILFVVNLMTAILP
jgi:hypothetical protein